MRKILSIINNEQGSALLLTFVILVLLTIVGTSSINTSSIETKIVINDKLYRESFFKAEAAAFEAAQKIKNNAISNPAKVNANTNGTDDYVNPESVNLRDVTGWDFDGQNGDDTAATSSVADTYYAASFSPGSQGGSINVAKSEAIMCDFTAHGYHNSKKGNVHIEIGFKTRVLYQ